MTNKIYAFIGPHAVGKKTFIRRLISMGIHYVPIYTTCPPGKRTEGILHCIEKMDFAKQDFLFKTTYKGHYYGHLKKDILESLRDYPITLILSDATSLRQLSKFIKDNFESIYIMCDYVSLIDRMLHMGETNNEMKGHLEYAENNGEFESWKIATHVVKNVSSEEKAFLQILSILGLTETMPEEKIHALVEKQK